MIGGNNWEKIFTSLSCHWEHSLSPVDLGVFEGANTLFKWLTKVLSFSGHKHGIFCQHFTALCALAIHPKQKVT